MMIKCKWEDCQRVWDYKGDRKHFISCPDCKRNIKISECRVDNSDIKEVN